MEACVVICRMKKEPKKAGKVLFINAVNEVTRKNAESYLEDKHIDKILKAYEGYKDIEGFARIATVKDIKENKYSLNIPLYAREQQQESQIKEISIKQGYNAWVSASQKTANSYNTLKTMLNEEK